MPDGFPIFPSDLLKRLKYDEGRFDMMVKHETIIGSSPCDGEISKFPVRQARPDLLSQRWLHPLSPAGRSWPSLPYQKVFLFGEVARLGGNEDIALVLHAH